MAKTKNTKKLSTAISKKPHVWFGSNLRIMFSLFFFLSLYDRPILISARATSICLSFQFRYLPKGPFYLCMLSFFLYWKKYAPTLKWIRCCVIYIALHAIFYNFILFLLQDASFRCHNYINAIKEYNNDWYYCGTNGFNPGCWKCDVSTKCEISTLFKTFLNFTVTSETLYYRNTLL